MQTFLANIAVLRIAESLSQTELLSQMAARAAERGWVKPGFCEALLARESAFPTGLHAHRVDVAIPHADPEWTLLPGLVVAVLDHPVAFQPMGGVGEVVQAEYVFMLVIPDADAHIDFLRTLAEFIEDEERMQVLLDTRDVDYLISALSGSPA
jgi:galactitol PTS system EIIA component